MLQSYLFLGSFIHWALNMVLSITMIVVVWMVVCEVGLGFQRVRNMVKARRMEDEDEDGGDNS